MIDERATTPVAPEPVGESGPEVEKTEEPELDLDDLEAADPEGQSADDETAEVEVDGKKFSIPAALKDKFLMQSDYTKKTQTLAEERRQLEQAGKDFQAQQKALQSHFAEAAKLTALDEQLAWYDKIDWLELNRQDPVKVQELRIQRETLERQRNDLGVKLANEWQTRVTHEQQELAKQYEQGLAVVSKFIPNWSQDYANKLTDFGSKQYDLSKEQLKQIQMIAPGAVAALDDAHKFRQLLEKQRARAKAPQETPEPVPVTTVGTRRSPASSEPRDSDDIETWMKKRNMQVVKRRQAGLR